MFDGLTTDMATRFLLAAAGVGLGLFVLIGVLMVLRRRRSTLFVRGGKSRVPRLLVLDAAAVDAKRRLVLIKRDNVEHLIMIGGPTDIVIESGIGQATSQPQDTENRKRIRQAARQESAAAAAASEDFPNLLNESPVRDVEREPRRAQPGRRAHEPALTREEPSRPAAAILATPPKAVEQEVSADEPGLFEEEIKPEIAAETRERAAERDIQAFELAIFEEEEPTDEPPTEIIADEKPVVAAPQTPKIPEAESEVAGTVVPTPTPTREMPAVAQAMAEPVPRPPVAQQQTPVVAPAAALAASAEDILDAARHRVLQVPHQSGTNLNEDRPVTVMTEQTPVYRSIRTDAHPQEASLAERQAQITNPSTPTRRDELAMEFEKILEAEMMANGISLDGEIPAAGRIADLSLQPQEPAPVVTPPSDKITGARAESSLEKEMARLLGEMSVTRKN